MKMNKTWDEYKVLRNKKATWIFCIQIPTWKVLHHFARPFHQA